LLVLDSADRHAERGRYSYLAADPVAVFGAEVGEDASVRASFEQIREAVLTDALAPIPGLPPFQGGLGFLLGYELGRRFERLPASRHDEFGLPDWSAALYDWVISFDHLTNRAWIVSSGIGSSPTKNVDPHRAESRLKQVLTWLRKPAPPEPTATTPGGKNLLAPADLVPQHPLSHFTGVTSNFSRSGYETAVRRVIEYIHAGDCFQVNLSQRLLAPLREPPLELYGRLRSLNPSPFAAYYDAGDFQVLSTSPERFLQVNNGCVSTRPIKGTRPRYVSPEGDRAVVDELMQNPKDRSENVMIVDLLRNDLGKVCEFGSVRVPTLCTVETFPFVHHLVSEVTGKLKPGFGLFDLWAAAFPGGSVTGAPKVRAMEIISELEPTARGPYCGSLGWLGWDGSSDSNILIRTFTAARGWVQFPVGGGIVVDSNPAREYEETLHKATGLLRALR
jgi:para-aminobenzoate synthetase component 1